jgi:hypothetical protein
MGDLQAHLMRGNDAVSSLDSEDADCEWGLDCPYSLGKRTNLPIFSTVRPPIVTIKKLHIQNPIS